MITHTHTWTYGHTQTYARTHTPTYVSIINDNTLYNNYNNNYYQMYRYSGNPLNDHP